MTREPITITIKPPVKGYCKRCGWETHGLVPRECPECGGRTWHGRKPLSNPPMTVSCLRGRYNWANPSEVQYQYIVHNAPNGKQYSFILDEEIDTDDAVEAIFEIEGIVSRYLFYSDYASKIEELVNLLTEEERERQYLLAAKARKEQLEAELYDLYDQYGDDLAEVTR